MESASVTGWPRGLRQVVYHQSWISFLQRTVDRGLSHLMKTLAVWVNSEFFLCRVGGRSGHRKSQGWLDWIGRGKNRVTGRKKTCWNRIRKWKETRA